MAKAKDELVRLAVRIPKSLHRRLKVYAVTQDRTVQDVVTAILTDRLPKGDA